ncbi:MAG: Hint domain-containing protein [Paracoccaceae bacterium]|nr:Hint domain-containing protein [Paracoccaceae bacterium]
MRIRPDTQTDLDSDRPEAGRRRSLGSAGLTAGTRVLTDGGWMPVEQISEGDRMMTFDGGPEPVTSVRRRTFGANLQTYWPHGLVYVPDGALGPAEAYYLLPGQAVMLRTDLARSMFDDPATLVPAAALVGIRGICRVMPIDLVEVIELRFAEEAIVEAQGGTWLRCPGVSVSVQSAPLRRRRVFSQAGAA